MFQKSPIPIDILPIFCLSVVTSTDKKCMSFSYKISPKYVGFLENIDDISEMLNLLTLLSTNWAATGDTMLIFFSNGSIDFYFYFYFLISWWILGCSALRTPTSREHVMELNWQCNWQPERLVFLLERLKERKRGRESRSV